MQRVWEMERLAVDTVLPDVLNSADSGCAQSVAAAVETRVHSVVDRSVWAEKHRAGLEIR